MNKEIAFFKEVKGQNEKIKNDLILFKTMFFILNFIINVFIYFTDKDFFSLIAKIQMIIFPEVVVTDVS